MKELQSFKAPGLYSDAECTRLISSWNSLEDAGVVHLRDGVLTGSSTLDDVSRLNGFLLIPKCVECIGDFAFACETGLLGVYTMEDLESIGESAFAGCGDLVAVEVKCRSIRANAFTRCVKLESMLCTDSVLVVADTAFGWCESLKSVVVPKNATIADNAFFGCKDVNVEYRENDK